MKTRRDIVELQQNALAVHSFERLLQSMGVTSAEYDGLCETLWNEDEKKANKTYQRILWALAGAAALVLGVFLLYYFYMFQKKLLSVAAISAGVLLVLPAVFSRQYLKKANWFHLQPLERMLVHFRSSQNLKTMIDDLRAAGGNTIHGERRKKLPFFSTMPGIILVLLVAAIQLVGFSELLIPAVYAPNDDGVTLLAWRGQPDANGEVVIPDTVEGRPVTAIGKLVFANQLSIRSVVIPETVRIIDSGAFQKCTYLNTLTLPEGLEVLGAEVFQDCVNLKNIIIPAGVQEIRAYAFSGCRKLKSIEFSGPMPGGKISEYAFSSCGQLESIIIPEGIIKISAHAFEDCTQLASVTVPDSLETIGSSAFRRCMYLKEIVLPQKCQVNERAFKESPTQIVRAD